MIQEDDIRVSFGCRNQKDFAPVFSELKKAIVRRGVNVGLYVKDIVKFLEKNSQCQLYINSPGSATRYLLNQVFTKTTGKEWGWSRGQNWELRVALLEEESRPWMAFGPPDNISRLEHWAEQKRARSVQILRKNGEPLTRGLYLYGRLRRIKKSGRESVFGPDERVARMLKKLLTKLMKSEEVTKKNIYNQIVLFGLEEGMKHSLLTETNSTDGCIYGYERTMEKPRLP